MKNAFVTLLESCVLTAMVNLTSSLTTLPTQGFTLLSETQDDQTEKTGCTDKLDFNFAQGSANFRSIFLLPTTPTALSHKPDGGLRATLTHPTV